MSTKIVSHSIQQTWRLAEKLVGKYSFDLKEKPLVLALEGELGTGKTTFTKGMEEILEVPRPVRSPGYILVREYFFNLNANKGKLFHVDLWRTSDEAEIEKLKIVDLVEPPNILVIEWAQKAPKLIDQICKMGDVNCVRVVFRHKGKNAREIEYEEIS
ncbi:tRNA (adenosine(37)-N6)-threonylcarbamoyltransferase complex ATPase subunit type 1 TsaE [Candidatus Saccharibacteria bacterium]|nr:tRNA (adenosine(37)-N6)-threonylcarbamoyltransferase complex ATPase subunit type 1 TsaE [Candidatus Saccharibacteria bacterium]